MKKAALLCAVALLPLIGAPAMAADDARDVEELIVTGEIKFRNREETAAPILSYDLDYFQRFEPLTAGDALKRVPSVTFLSDVLESDGARMRGLDPGYTQILINGERVPGAGADRSFFVDRIPAELIERVEIVRSSSANRSGDAVAGAINIVLRDALAIDGGYVRAGGILLNDDKVKPTVAGVWGGQVGAGRLLVGASIQGRRNPKSKTSWRYDEPGADINDTEIQSDIRNGTDYSANASYVTPLGEAAELRLTGMFVRTDRTQFETSTEYDEGVEQPGRIKTTNINPLDILTDNYAFDARIKAEMLGGETTFKLGYAGINDRQDEYEDETTYDDDNKVYPEDDVFESTKARTRLKDQEWAGALQHKLKLDGFNGAALEFGVQAVQKTRDNDVSETETEIEIDDAPAPRPQIPGAYDPFESVPGGLNRIKERRIDPYVMLSGAEGRLKWEAGLRYETTKVTVTDETAEDDARRSEASYQFLLPSASIRFALTEADRITASVARTVRRPNFNFLSPALLEGEYGDNDFLGDPSLKPESAWGGDVGFEHRIGRRGVAGVNLFYRRISNLIEVVSTGDYSDEAEGNYDDAIDDGATPAEAAEELTSFVLTAANLGKAEVYGIEFDLSTPLDFIGLPDTGIFFNYSLLDSKVSDDFGKRRFNDQAKYVMNVGFIQDVRPWSAAFGATFRKQGASFGRIVGEEVTTTYGADLEVFLEKRFGDSMVVRLTGSNLLDSAKRESFNKFNTIEDQMDRDFDEYELERETAGPVFQLVVRKTF